MSLFRRIYSAFSRAPRHDYGLEVLFAGWVELPQGFWSRPRRGG
jgi:hypothetical protein